MKKLRFMVCLTIGLAAIETIYEWYYGKYFISPRMDWNTCDNLGLGLYVLRALLLIACIITVVMLHKSRKRWLYTAAATVVAVLVMLHGWGPNEEKGLYNAFGASAARVEVLEGIQESYREQEWMTVRLRDGSTHTGVDWTEGNITLNRELTCIIFMTHENRHGKMTYFVFFGVPSEKHPEESWDDFEDCKYGPLFQE